MARRPSAFERELEALLTLSRADIERARLESDARLRLIEFCGDEAVELREAAEEAFARGDDDLAWHCEQEASAWRRTARVLREMSRSADDARRASTQRSSRLA